MNDFPSLFSNSIYFRSLFLIVKVLFLSIILADQSSSVGIFNQTTAITTKNKEQKPPSVNNHNIITNLSHK